MANSEQEIEASGRGLSADERRGIAAGVFATIAPGGLFALRMVQTMRCWTIMRPFALVFGIVIAFAGAAMLFRAYARNRKAHKTLHRMARER